jgi:hypothetical protein
MHEAGGLRALSIFAGGVLSVRYSVISGCRKSVPRHGGLDALAVGGGLRDGGHRRLEVRHDDGAGELPRRVRHHGRQRGAVAQVQVPVVGAGEGERSA